MNFRTIVIAILMLVGVSFTTLSSANAEVKTNATQQETLDEYTRVRVLIDGVWWIIVYDADGKVVEIYTDVQC
jgi:hypothetical protein